MGQDDEIHGVRRPPEGRAEFTIQRKEESAEVGGEVPIQGLKQAKYTTQAPTGYSAGAFRLFEFKVRSTHTFLYQTDTVQ